jgi:hypothetical protein
MEDKQRIVSISADLYDKLSKRIETQDKIILMLNMQLSNARLKNENLEKLVTTRNGNGKTIED